MYRIIALNLKKPFVEIIGGTRLDKSHTINRLPVHTPDRQLVYFRLDMANVQEALEAARCTKLTEYFTLNSISDFARMLMYEDIPKHFVWNAKEKEWTRRKRGGEKVLSRIFHIAPEI